MFDFNSEFNQLFSKKNYLDLRNPFSCILFPIPYSLYLLKVSHCTRQINQSATIN